MGWIICSGSGQRSLLRFCELCNELSGSVWGKTFLSSAEWLLAAYMKTLPFTRRYATQQKLTDGEYPAVNATRICHKLVSYPLRNMQQPILQTLLNEENFPLSRKNWVSHSAVTECSRTLGCYAVLTGIQFTHVAQECCAFTFGIRQSPLSPLVTVFNRQMTIISSYLPYFTHSLSFILMNNISINLAGRLTCTWQENWATNFSSSRSVWRKFWDQILVTVALAQEQRSTGIYWTHTKRKEC